MNDVLATAIRNFIRAWEGEVDCGMFFCVIPDGEVGKAIAGLKRVLPPKGDDSLVRVAHEIVWEWESLMDEDELDYSDLYGIKSDIRTATNILAGIA